MRVLLKLCILLMTICCSSEVAVLASARLTYRDPLVPYMAVMPGQSIDALKDYPCQVRASTKTNTQWGVCEFPSYVGPFGQIVLTAYGHIIEQTYMNAQPDRLHLGDLILCWGKFSLNSNDYESAPPKWTARWGSAVYTNVRPEAVYGRASPFMPIDYLNIEGRWLPCRSTE